MANLGESLDTYEIKEMIREAYIDGDSHIRYEQFLRMFLDGRVKIV